MNARSSSASVLAVFVLLAGTTPVQAQAPAMPALTPEAPAPDAPLATTPIKSRWLEFSVEEIARYRAIAEARQQRRESYIRATEDDEIVFLEPYIVEGDYSLELARLRRDLDQRSSAHVRSVVLQDPTIQRQLDLDQRNRDAFFNGPSPGAPADHVRAGVDLRKAPGAIADAFRRRRVGDLFRSPEAAAKE